MLISHYKKIVFIHVPKNAGTSFQQTIQEKIPGCLTGLNQQDRIYFHSTIRQIQDLWDISDYFKFAVIRNPWDRMWSFYRFSVQRWPKALRGYDFKRFLFEFPSYMDKSHLPGEPQVRTQERPQWDWFVDKEGNMVMDFLVRYENLEKDFKKILEKIRIINNLKWIRKTPIMEVPYTEAYDNEMIDFVAYHHKKDLEAFGYQYGTQHCLPVV